MPMYDDDGRLIPDFKPPVNDRARLHTIAEVARLHGEAHNSDPFATARATLHMKRGLAWPDEVKSEATKAIQVRRDAAANRD